MAREQGFDALLTISNEIPPVAGQHPTAVDKRKLKKVALHHLSWSQVLSEAVMRKEHRGVADPDQAWILGELIRYLEHPRSAALEFDDMGPSWVPTREALVAGTLRATRWRPPVGRSCPQRGSVRNPLEWPEHRRRTGSGSSVERSYPPVTVRRCGWRPGM